FSGRRTHPYALLSTSPCIDTGDTSEIAHMTSISVFTHEIIWSFTYSPYDAGNSDRLADGDSDGTEAVDMGAYEFMR
ncbi:MAG TPA: hypothetical protein PK636_10360, partial [bacterium]|nr:hypothetical protein [bacterium]